MSRILHLASDANFYLYRKPVKMSRSFDGLAAVIKNRAGQGHYKWGCIYIPEQAKDDNEDLCL